MKTNTYTLEGTHEHLFFEPIHDLKLSVSLKSVPNLILSYLHLCGKVILNLENISQEGFPLNLINLLFLLFLEQNSKITIYLESKTEKRTTFPDQNGNYCFEVQNFNIYFIFYKYLIKKSY